MKGHKNCVGYALELVGNPDLTGSALWLRKGIQAQQAVVEHCGLETWRFLPNSKDSVQGRVVFCYGPIWRV